MPARLRADYPASCSQRAGAKLQRCRGHLEYVHFVLRFVDPRFAGSRKRRQRAALSPPLRTTAEAPGRIGEVLAALQSQQRGALQRS